MAISEISLLSNLPHQTAAPTNMADVAAEFDAMIWELLLRESGMTRAFGSSESEGAETTMYGEMLVQHLARQLAGQIDIGFGRMALAQAQGGDR